MKNSILIFFLFVMLLSCEKDNENKSGISKKYLPQKIFSDSFSKEFIYSDDNKIVKIFTMSVYPIPTYEGYQHILTVDTIKYTYNSNLITSIYQKRIIYGGNDQMWEENSVVEYNSQGLVSSIYSDNPQNGEEKFTYDINGNIIQIEFFYDDGRFSQGPIFEYNSNNNISSYALPNSTEKKKFEYYFDSEINPFQLINKKLGYPFFRNETEVSQNNLLYKVDVETGDTIENTYVYDDLNRVIMINDIIEVIYLTN